MAKIIDEVGNFRMSISQLPWRNSAMTEKEPFGHFCLLIKVWVCISRSMGIPKASNHLGESSIILDKHISGSGMLCWRIV